MIVAETPATIVVSQINPSPPELSTPFPQDTAMAGSGGVGSGEGTGGAVGVGGSVGAGVTAGGTVGVTTGAVGCIVGSGVRGGSVTVGAGGGRVARAVGPTVGGASITEEGVTVAVEPLGAAGDGRDSEGDGLAQGDHAGSGGRTIGAIAERVGAGEGVGDGCAIPTSAALARIPPTQVTATIAANGVRSRGTHGTGGVATAPVEEQGGRAGWKERMRLDGS